MRLKCALYLGSAAMAFASPAFAQTGPAAAPAKAEEVVVVTGSRIARDPNVAAPVPIQSVNAEAIAMSGASDISDVLNDIPALLSSGTSETSLTDIAGAPTGGAVLNLRGMGSERTLVLVDGRRHVSGVEGSSAVDVTSIPGQLIQRVEVLTGGASALYGADAVTGVVNFILKKDFEGLEFDMDFGISEEGDGERTGFSAIWGKNYNNDKGNIVVAAGFSSDAGLKFGDREQYRDNGITGTRANPARRFQNGDITSSATPNLARLYDYNTTGRFRYGLSIPTEAGFISTYTRIFGVAPVLTEAERALFTRAANAPSRAFGRQPVFTVSSPGGIIAPGDFSYATNVDLDRNGTPDCLDSFVGYNSGLDGASSFGIVGGCWNINADGSIRPIRDGLISGNFDGFGGDGIAVTFDEEDLVPRDVRYNLNLLGGYQINDNHRAFYELKYARADVRNSSPYNTFWDLLYGAPDNPYLPAQLRQLANDTGGLYITRDMTDVGDASTLNERTTIRGVFGLEGELPFGAKYDISATYGQFNLTQKADNVLIMDRFFASIDAVRHPTTGQVVCRSDIDPTLAPTTIFGIPPWDANYFTFRPGDGSCRPGNIWGGVGNIGQDALDFFMTSTVTKEEITQTFLQASMTGDSAKWFSLPAGPISYAIGAEYRKETSAVTNDPLNIGILPGTGNFPAGTLIEDVSDNESPVYDPAAAVLNASGEYDVYDAFVEISVPLLKDVPFFEELTIDGAYRVSEYSSVGQTATWKGGFSWAPVSDLRFRGTISEAVRAPNIFELFSPDQGVTFRPIDPCSQPEIDALRQADAATATIRERNCRAGGAGLPALPNGWTDPLSSRFFGVTGGNARLQEETAETRTIGFVFQPRFVPGLSVTVDYWDVAISGAIAAVAAQDIVDNCYDSTTFPTNQYCALFTRNTTAGSAQFGGFTFLRQTQTNFGAIEAEGIDFAVTYRFEWRENDFRLSVTGSQQRKLDNFFDPGDLTAVDPELGERFRPEWSGTFGAMWKRGPYTVNWQTQYVGEQLLSGAELETYETIFGAAAEQGATYNHNLSGRYEFGEGSSLILGVNNVTGEKPYVTERAFPVSPRGRYLFMGLNLKY